MNKETIFKTLEYVITSSGSAETYYKIWTANPETPTYAFRTYLSTNEWSFYIDVDNKGSWKINNFSNSGSAVISFAIDANQLFIKTTKHLDLTCRTEVLYGEIVNALPKVDPTAQSKSWNIIANGTTVSQDNTNDLTVLNNANIEKQLNVTGTNSTVTTQTFNVTDANTITTADFNVTKDANITGNTNVAKNLNVTGSTSAVNVTNSLNVTGTNSTVKTNSFTVAEANTITTTDFNVAKDANITGDTNVTGNATTTNLNVTQNATVSNNLNVTGSTSTVNITKDLNVSGTSSAVNINKDLNVKGNNAVVNATNLNVANASSINTTSFNVSQNANITGNVNLIGSFTELNAQGINAANITATKSVNVTNDLSLTGNDSTLSINGNLNSKYGNVNVNRINFNNTESNTNVNVNTQELHYIVSTTKTGDLYDIYLADDSWNQVEENKEKLKVGTFNKKNHTFNISDIEYIYYPKDAQIDEYYYVYYNRYDKALASSSEEIKEKFNKTALAGKYSPTTNRLIIKGFLTIEGDINVEALVINGVTRSSGLATGLDINAEASTLVYQKKNSSNNKSSTELTELMYKAPVKDINGLVSDPGKLIATNHTIEAKEFIGSLEGTAKYATYAGKLTTNAGSGINPIYFSGGIPVASSSTVGTTTKPVYLNAGTLTECSEFATKGHDHDGIYLPIEGKAADSDLLDSHDSTYFATSDHNHDDKYLGILAKAADSDLLDSHDSTYFATADHNHDDRYSLIKHDHTLDLSGDVTGSGTVSGAIDTEIAVNAVTTPKIKNLNVTTEKIADNAVTKDKIADKAVTSDKIDSVLPSQIKAAPTDKTIGTSTNKINLIGNAEYATYIGTDDGRFDYSGLREIIYDRTVLSIEESENNGYLKLFEEIDYGASGGGCEIKVYTLPTASNLAKGGVKVGDGLSIDSTTGVLSTNITYEEIQPKVVK